jgi:hypothetical protein
VYGAVALFALAAGIARLALPRRTPLVLPVGLGAVLVATSVSAAEEFADRAQAGRPRIPPRTGGGSTTRRARR